MKKLYMASTINQLGLERFKLFLDENYKGKIDAFVFRSFMDELHEDQPNGFNTKKDRVSWSYELSKNESKSKKPVTFEFSYVELEFYSDSELLEMYDAEDLDKMIRKCL